MASPQGVSPGTPLFVPSSGAAAVGHPARQRCHHFRAGQPAVASDHDTRLIARTCFAADRLADALDDRGRERLADDTADGVGFEDFRWERDGGAQAVILGMFRLFVVLV